MSEFRASFTTHISIVVNVNAATEDEAADVAWGIAEGYLQTLGTQTGDERIRFVEASLDGIGADEIEALS